MFKGNTMNEIAIDFGTTRTKLAKYDQEKEKSVLIEIGREIRPVLPSIFYIPKEGDILVGDDAQDELENDPAGIVRGLKLEIDKDEKIRLNNRKIDRIELLSNLFHYIRQRCESEVFFGSPVTKCTLTVPVKFLPYERNCIRKALELAGFEEINTVEEPVAAAYHWLRNSDLKTDFIVVCDIGGGTTDIALLQRNEHVIKPHPEVEPDGFSKGGNSIDEAIWDNVIYDIPEEAFSKIGKKLSGYLIQLKKYKELFSRRKDDSVLIPIEDYKIPLHRETVKQCSEKFSDRVCETLKRFVQKMQETGIEKAPVLLVGGGMNILGLKDAIESLWDEEVGDKVYVWQDSEYATVLGALLENVEVEPAIKKESIKGKEEKYFQEALNIWNEVLNEPAITQIHNYNSKDVCTNCACSKTAIESNGWSCSAIENNVERVKEFCEQIIEKCDVALDFDSQAQSSIFLKAAAEINLKRYEKARDALSKYDIVRIDQDFSFMYGRCCLYCQSYLF